MASISISGTFDPTYQTGPIYGGERHAGFRNARLCDGRERIFTRG